MKKYSLLFSFIFIMVIVLSSCSKTRDGLGLDTINNSARTGKWEVVHQIYIGTSSDPVTTDSLTAGDAYAKFQSDNKVHYYNEDGVDNPSDATTYSFLDTKTMIYGGDEYNIQENLAASFSKMTLQRNTATGREVYIFAR
ncbi:MAG: hypothetical protein QM640_03465 [Niabella sp.]